MLHRRVGGRSFVMRRFSTLSRRVASFRAAAPRCPRTFSTMPRTWGRPAEGPTFHPDFPTEFRPSPIAGVGWWATVDIPKGTLLRRLSVADGTLVRFSSREDLEEAGWDLDDAVNYGIGHWRDPSAIFFLNPGTAVNHADKTREAAVMYNHDEPNVGAPASVRPSPRVETYPLAGPRAVHDERRQGRRGNALRLRSRLRPLPLV